ncbi:hypothetical protein R5W24_003912 [Gemmata sp. JC717]|uniref:hypothetical protein n=1 Tax=Gemmata algarum TaxID=2975278 RepID=UPI0021BB01E8|nr:hypothetical protein [Gemmata algarum]MDY3554783.1 hypothetical protein [Gemmata algarum]
MNLNHEELGPLGNAVAAAGEAARRHLEGGAHADVVGASLAGLSAGLDPAAQAALAGALVGKQASPDAAGAVAAAALAALSDEGLKALPPDLVARLRAIHTPTPPLG